MELLGFLVTGATSKSSVFSVLHLVYNYEIGRRGHGSSELINHSSERTEEDGLR